MTAKKPLIIVLFLAFSLISVFSIRSAPAAVWEAAHPLASFLELVDLSYDYDPSTGTVTLNYQYKNISGSAITNPRAVTLFNWSNDICPGVWDSMGYNGSDTFSNAGQSSTVVAPDGLFNWNANITSPTPPLDSNGVFPTLPGQLSQNGVSYPYFDICSSTAGSWADQEVAAFSTSFTVDNAYWVQSETLVVGCEGVDCPAFPDFDGDSDSATDCSDTCPSTPNAAGGGRCASVLSGLVVATNTPCTDNGDCTGFCTLSQEPEACVCHADVTGSVEGVPDGEVGLSDLVKMKIEYFNTCPPGPCLADLNGDGEVGIGDLVIMKVEYFRGNCTP
jgi:hypothetical protein